MLAKFQIPIPGDQPVVTAGSLATMAIQPGPRISVIYAKLFVTKAAVAGVVSLPVLTDVADPTLPMFVRVGGRPMRQRLATEIIAENLLQDPLAGGSVAYYQGAGGVTPANLVARVLNANNASSAGLNLAINTATTAVFFVPIYFAEFWRKDVNSGDGFAFPTNYQGGLVSRQLTLEVPIANNAGGLFSGWGCKFTYVNDGIQWPLNVNNQPTTATMKKGRFTKAYATAGDINIPIPLKDAIAQFSVLLDPADRWSRMIVRLNGLTLRDFTPDDLSQLLQDSGMNVLAFLPNQCHVIFDVNDDLNAVIPLKDNDTLEVILTISNTPAAARQAVILTEYYGFPD